MKTSEGWILKKETLVYETPWIRVRDCDVIAPTGNPAKYGAVSMKQRAVGILPVDEDGNTWLVGQHRFCLNDYTWEIPEGGAAPDETPLDAGRRELAEEVGLAATHMLPILDSAQISNSITDEIGFGFIASGLSPVSGFEQDDTEALAVRKLPVREALAMVDREEITDMLSIVILLKAHRLAIMNKLPEQIAKAFV